MVGPEHPYYEIGLRLYAAVVSYQMGVSVQSVMRKEQGSPLAKSWSDLGQALLRAAQL